MQLATIPFGFCEHVPVWAIHYIPGYFFWPPIPKCVCAVLVHFSMWDVVVSPAVKQNVSIVMSGDVRVHL